MKIKIYRQGDVYLKQIDKLPEGLIKKNKVLAEGETTGHKHQFNSATTQVYSNSNGTQYATLEKIDTLTHEEHASIEVPAGTYEVVLQREYSPLEGVRTVTD